MDRNQIIFETVVGSRAYGMHHAENFIQTSAESYPKPEKLGDIDVLNQVLRTAAFNL